LYENTSIANHAHCRQRWLILVSLDHEANAHMVHGDATPCVFSIEDILGRRSRGTLRSATGVFTEMAGGERSFCPPFRHQNRQGGFRFRGEEHWSYNTGPVSRGGAKTMALSSRSKSCQNSVRIYPPARVGFPAFVPRPVITK